MKFSKHLFTDKATQKHKRRIKYRLNHSKAQVLIYVITLNLETGRPELIHSLLLMQEYYKKNPPFIIGFAEGKDNATALMAKMVSDALDETGSMDIREWLFRKGR